MHVLFSQCKNEAVKAMSRVLVGVEMLRCNRNHGLMEFSVPSLTMVRSTMRYQKKDSMTFITSTGFDTKNPPFVFLL